MDNIMKDDLQKVIVDKIHNIQRIIQNTLISIAQYKMLDIFTPGDCTICVSSLNELYAKTMEPLDENAIENTQAMVDRLSGIICAFGTRSAEDLLYVCGEKYEPESEFIVSKFNLIKRFFHPTGYKIIHWKAGNKPTKYKDNNCLCSNNNITQKLEGMNQLECVDVETTNRQFYSKVYGLRVISHNEKSKQTIIMNGIMDDIIVGCIDDLKYINKRKTEIMDNVDDKEIVQRIVDALSLRDLMVCGNADIHSKYANMTTDVNMVKNNKLDVIMKRMVEMDMYSQRNTLMSLFIYNKDDHVQYITYLLYDLVTNANANNKLYDSFPWKIKEYFKELIKHTVKYTQNMTQAYDLNRVTLDQQIFLMKAPENVKEKAIIKLKEIKGKSDESCAKAKQYLEGLLKIPFGTYKEEPLLKIVKDINKQFKDLNYKCEIPKKVKYTNVEIIKYTTIIEESLKTDIINNIKLGVDTIKIKDLKIIANMKMTSANKGKCIIQLLDKCNQSTIEDNMQLLTRLNDIHGLTEYNTLYTLHVNIIKIKADIKQVETYMNEVTSVLDDSIYGHNHAKNQIIKIIGQWMSGKQSGYCFGFEGAPGVGKTSLAKRGLAYCLKDGETRPFTFIAVGGSCNGSTLEGHGYTYVNSIWGRIVDILMDTKCMNPIIYIDELDKVSKTEHGKEIIGILTHLIDPTQNDTFQDKYFGGIDLDLSKALFIFSYNDPELIDKILLDRIHRIKFDNLQLIDKVVIVNKYILPEMNLKMGFENVVEMSNDIIEYIIDAYTVESGVRKLKEIIFDLYGEINIQLLKSVAIEIPVIITKPLLDKYLNKYTKVQDTVIHKTATVGIVNGLWANSYGKGGIISIQSMFYPTHTFLELKLTGLQGDVMQESMHVAKSLAWEMTSLTQKQALTKQFDETRSQGLHVHCPEGAVSKDGPSAGMAITLALYSLLNNIPIDNTIAMTGEINLQGNVTAIGGLNLKILGGIRAGVKTFYYPLENQKEFDDIPKPEHIQFVAISHISELFAFLKM